MTTKFRGKDIKTGKWVEGYHVVANNRHFIVPFKSRLYQVGCVISTQPEPFIKDLVEVHPATVGQFTGLKDKHGKDIFEGDTIKCFTGWWPGTVFFKTDGSVGWAVQPLPEHKHNGVYGLNSNDEYEAIGSIHDEEAPQCRPTSGDGQ